MSAAGPSADPFGADVPRGNDRPTAEGGGSTRVKPRWAAAVGASAAPSVPPAVPARPPAVASPDHAPAGVTVPDADPPAGSVPRRIGFDHTDLGGWDVTVVGGSESGRGSVRPGSALLEEGDSFLVGLGQAFVVPANPGPVSFTYTDLFFDTTDPDAMNDAFEVSLVDDAGRPLVFPYGDCGDAFYNVTEGEGSALGAGVAEAAGAVTTVTLDVSGVAPGTRATLRFRLVNNDRDTGTSVRILDVLVPGANTPPVLPVVPDRGGVEGAGVAVSVPFTDPDAGDTHTARVDWGDGTTSAGVVARDPDGKLSVSATHAYPDDGVYHARLTVTDAAGAADSAPFAVAVTNAAPAVSAGVSFRLGAGGSLPEVVLAGEFLDPGFTSAAAGTAETFSAEVDWGDGVVEPLTLSVTPGGGSPTRGRFAAAHAYAGPGVYRARVTVRDDDGGVGGVAVPLGVARLSVTRALDYTAGGSVPVLVMRDPGFDAAAIDPASVRLGPAGARPANNVLQVRPADVRMNFAVAQTGARRGEATAFLTGRLTDGTPFASVAPVTVVGGPAPPSPSPGGPAKFFVADAKADAAFRYGPAGAAGGAFPLDPVAGDARGAAADAAGDRVWVVDGATHAVTVQAPDGALLGSWRAEGLQSPAGVTTDGADVWVVDAGARKVVRYAGAAALASGMATPAASFALAAENASPTDLVTDGGVVWVTDDARDEVFVYDTAGSPLGRWRLDPANADASGITRDPTGASPDLWILDRADRAVYAYAGGTAWRDGERSAGGSFALAPGNDSPEGIADPPGPVVVVDSPRDGERFPVGGTVLVSGRATPGDPAAGVASVTLGGSPVEALDPAGNFFSRTTVLPGPNVLRVDAADAASGAGFTALTVEGVRPAVPDLAGVWDVSGSVAGEYGRTAYDAPARTVCAELSLRNTGQYEAGGPLLVAVRNVSDPTVRLLGADGTTPDGLPYLDFSSLLGGQPLAPGASTASRHLEFANPDGVRFTYELVFLGRLNRDPRFVTVPDVEAVTGKPHRYAATAADPDGDPVTYSLGEAPAGMAVGEATGVVTWAPGAADVGTHAVTVRADDGRGGVAEQRYVLAAVTPPPNRPPVFTTTPPAHASPGSEYRYGAVAEDADGDPVTYRLLAGAPAGMTVNKTTGELLWTPTDAQRGDRQANVMAEDGRGGATVQTIIVCVEGTPNRPPVIVSDPVTTVGPADGRAEYAYDVEALDPDGGPVTYTLLDAPPRMGIDAKTGLISWAAAAGPQANLVRNGDFSQGAVGFTTDLAPAAGTVADGAYQVADKINHPTAVSFPDHTTRTGNMLVVDGAAAADTYWRQEVAVEPDTTYELSLWAAPWNNNRFARATVTVNGQPLGPQVGTGFSDGQWTRYTADWTSGATTTAVLAIQANGSSGSGAFAFDDIAFAAASVPGGTYNVTVRADDGRGGAAEQRFAVRVKDTPTAAPQFDPVVRWRLPAFAAAPGESGVMATPAVADWDGDGRPDVIVPTFAYTLGLGGKGGLFVSGTPRLRVVRPFDGTEVLAAPVEYVDPTVTPAVADLDGDGRPDAVVGRLWQGGARTLGNNYAAAVGNDGRILWYNTAVSLGTGGAASVADLDGDGNPEVIVGAAVLDGRTGQLLWQGKAGTGRNTSPGGGAYGPLSVAADLDRDGAPEVLAGNTAYRRDGTVYWQAKAPDGFAAVGNFDADPFPEVVLVSGGGVYLLEHDGTPVWGPVAIPGGGRGAAPAVADLDGDGTPEIVTAGASRLVVLSAAGVPLWDHPAQSGASEATGATAFDFDGDGRREVVFGDDESLFVFDGPTGAVVFRTDRTTASVTEYPVVADLDLDGHAEILVGANDNVNSATVPLSRGLLVVGDRGNATVPTRGVWNQYEYHVTNVNDDGSIPPSEAYGWQGPNTYRANTGTRTDGTTGLPDMVVATAAGGAAAGGYRFTATVGNVGWAGVGAGVPVTFYDGDPDRGGTPVGTVLTPDPVPAGGTTVVSLDTPRVVNDLWARADDAGDGRGSVVEDDEANNARRAGFDADPVNYPPRATSVPVGEAARAVVGTSYAGRPVVLDPDGDTVTYTLVEGPAGMQVHPTLGVVAWTPLRDQVGGHRVVVRATDAAGHAAPVTFVVAAAAANTPPVLLADFRADAGAWFNTVNEYRFRAQDAEGSKLTFALAEPRPGMSIDPDTGLLRWDVGGGVLGNTGTVVVGDGETETRADFRLPLGFTDRPPVLRVEAAAAAWLGREYVGRATATDPDADAVRYALDVAPPGMTIDPVAGVIRWRPAAAGGPPETVTVRATDAKGRTAAASFEVRVSGTDPNRPPAVTSSPPATQLQLVTGETLAYDLTASDPDTDPVTWELVSGPQGMSINPETGTLRWTPADDQTGRHAVAVRAADAYGASAEQSFEVAVSCVNRQPVILSAPVTTANVGSPYTYAVRVADPDGDPVTLGLGSGTPAGMTVIPGTTVVRWTPTAAQVGKFTVTVAAFDGVTPAANQTFTIVVDAAPPNRPPAITSSAVANASVGLGYRYAVVAEDPEGEAVAYGLAAAPAGMTIDTATGVISWTPSAGQVGAAVVTVTATDPAGLVGSQRFTVAVTENSPPAITSAPVVSVPAGAVYRYDVRATDPDGGPLAYALTAAPPGMAIDGFGRIRWQTVPASLGSYPVSVRVTDPPGAEAVQAFTIVVAPPDTTPPAVSLQFSANPANVGGTVTIRVRAADDVGVTGTTLRIGGAVVATDPNGVAVYAADAVGLFEVAASATDAAGNTGTATGQLRVIDPRDTEGPRVTITSPAGGAAVTGPVDVVGTVEDAGGQLDFYRVYYARADLVDPSQAVWDPAAGRPTDPDYVFLGEGRSEVFDGRLATFDPSLLTNDDYVIVVAAFDVGGNGWIEPVRVSVTAGPKLGEFALSATDLQVPLAGIPVTVARDYTTLRAGERGDFGYGWSLAAADPRIRETVPQTGDGFLLTGGPFRAGTRVYLTNPEGKRVGFTFQPEPRPVLFGAGFLPKFVPDPGVTDTLEVDPATLTQRPDGTFALYLLGLPYNPDAYRLTTKVGLTYAYDQFAGLRTITDRNGTTLTFTRDGITSSTGVAVRFVRDPQGRIAQVIDPSGGVIRYAYDAAENLTSVTDQQGRVTRYTYRTDRPHYLDEAFDPLGNRITKNSYDAQGRLSGVTDALGNSTTAEYDPAAGTETVTDALGKVTVYRYDARGNVLAVTDPLGDTTEYGYDANDNQTSVTDPLGRTTTRTFDARRNLLTETDALGGVTRYEYNALDKVTKVTDPLGRVTVYLYDAKGNPTGTVDATGGVTRRTNDSRGRPLTETDANGRTTTYEYATAAAPGPTKVTHPDGTVRSFEYNAFGQVTRLTDEAGNVARFAYDGSGRLLSVIAPDGGVTRFGYTGDRLTSKTDPLNRVTRYAYDAAGRLVSTTDALDGVTAYEYDAAGRLTSETNPRGFTTTYQYRPDGRLESRTDALGGVTAYEYDAAGQLAAETDPLGHRWAYVHDAAGRLLSEADPLGNATRYTYDAAGNTLTITDRRNFTTAYAYDALNRLVATTDALGGVTRSQYDAAGNVVARTDANGHATLFAYDARDRLVLRTDPAGGRQAYGYDAAGNRTSVTDELGFVTRSTFDGLGRVLTVTAPDTGVTAYTYDLAGNRLAVTDPLGRTTAYEYDDLGRLGRETDPLEGVTAYAYDASGNRTALTDPVGNRTEFEFDALDRLVRHTDPLGAVSAFTYDAAGNRTESVDRDGRRRTFAYDALDRQTGETWWAGPSAVRTITYGYDAEGNLTSALDPDATYAFTYDALGRQLTADNAGTPGLPRVVLTSQYDAVGNRTRVSDGAGVAVASLFDARDLLASRTWQGAGVVPARIDFGYDARGQRTSTTRFADLAGTARVGSSVQGYDPVGRTAGITHRDTAGVTLAEYLYEYDPAGQLVRETRDGVAIDYAYDRTSQLVGADRSAGPDEAYRYDANGNRASAGYTVGAGNRVLSDGTFTYGYDAEGNRVEKVELATNRVTTYEYDHRNRLVRATERDAGGAVLADVAFRYDALDRRIARTAGGATTATIYDGDHAWLDADATGAVTARYLFGNRVDEVLARSRPADGTAWYLTDQLGTVRALVGPSGTEINRTDYDSFGRILSQANPTAGDRFGFTGREFDTSAGLYYYRARYYDPLIGQFTAEDPVGFGGGDPNLYRYGLNAPSTFSDPLGLSALTYQLQVSTISLSALAPLLLRLTTGAVVVGGGLYIAAKAERASLLVGSIQVTFAILTGALDPAKIIRDRMIGGNVTLNKQEDGNGSQDRDRPDSASSPDQESPKVIGHTPASSRGAGRRAK